MCAKLSMHKHSLSTGRPWNFEEWHAVYANIYNLMPKWKRCVPTHDCTCTCMYYACTRSNVVYVHMTICVPLPAQDRIDISCFSKARFSKRLEWFCTTLPLMWLNSACYTWHCPVLAQHREGEIHCEGRTVCEGSSRLAWWEHKWHAMCVPITHVCKVHVVCYFVTHSACTLYACEPFHLGSCCMMQAHSTGKGQPTHRSRTMM